MIGNVIVFLLAFFLEFPWNSVAQEGKSWPIPGSSIGMKGEANLLSTF